MINMDTVIYSGKTKLDVYYAIELTLRSFNITMYNYVTTSWFNYGWFTFIKDGLVAGFNHLEKYEFVNGFRIIPYLKWKIIQMFETTNQMGIQ